MAAKKINKDCWERFREMGIAKERLRLFLACVRKMKDTSAEKKDLLAEIWQVQLKINMNVECLTEVLFDYVDSDAETVDMETLQQLREERQRLFAERERLENILQEDEAATKLECEMKWCK